jgi:heat shock protein HslJ
MRSLFLAALVLIATAAQAVPPMPSELARTTWRWISLITPEETLTIAEPERYILRFLDGGRVALRADCNRGAGSVVFPEPGAISFGALATTRAMCPARSVAASRVRSSALAAGRSCVANYAWSYQGTLVFFASLGSREGCFANRQTARAARKDGALRDSRLYRAIDEVVTSVVGTRPFGGGPGAGRPRVEHCADEHRQQQRTQTNQQREHWSSPVQPPRAGPK